MNTKWYLITRNGFEYAVCCGQMYKCTTKLIYNNSPDLSSWIWIHEIRRYVNCWCK